MSSNIAFIREHIEFKDQFEAIVRTAVDRQSAEKADADLDNLCKTYMGSHPDLRISNLSHGMVASYERDREYGGIEDFRYLNTLKLTKSFWVIFIVPGYEQPVSMVSRVYLKADVDANVEIVVTKIEAASN
jgi:hypothetical protein